MKRKRTISSIKELMVTALDKHKRQKGKLLAPFHPIQSNPSFHFISWKDDYLPLYFWAAMMTALHEREAYLAKFREILGRVKYRREQMNEEIYLNHISLEKLTNQQFDFVFEPILSTEESRKDFWILSQITSLPDVEHWKRYEVENADKHASILAKGISNCFDHQSRSATDVRWLIMMSHFANHKLILAHENAKERFKQYVDYPKDETLVGSSVRATEINLRQMFASENGYGVSKVPHDVSEGLWNELYSRSNCDPLRPAPPRIFPNKEIGKELTETSQKLVEHFYQTISTTGVDPRHEGAFGLVFYAISLACDALTTRDYEFLSEKMLLRSIVEAHINLRYLRVLDTKSLWFQFRNYGSAQLKLSLLKYLDLNTKPKYVDVSQLFWLANEDMWLEHQEIDLGSWANVSLREMAIKGKAKRSYDKYYQLLSVYAHSQWGAIRESTFTVCANPLHRFHRIPAFPRPSHETVMVDMCTVINLMLADLNRLYPKFGKKLQAHKKLRPMSSAEGN